MREMERGIRPFGARAVALVAILVGMALALSACGSSSSGTKGKASSSSSKSGGGSPVAVIYAGSLSKLMEDDIGPAFQKATGYSFQGFGGGSGEDAAQIKARERKLDVFISASAEADKELQGAAHGDWVSWYVSFASTPLAVGFNPASRYGKELKAGRPWYEVLAQSGIRVGRTDPKLDPKGALTVEAVEEAARKLNQPALKSALRSFPVFPETALVGRLQAGQLDAGFFYAIEAHVAGVPTVSIAPVHKSAIYTVTILNRAPNRAGAEAFVRFLLQSSTASTLTSNGLTSISPLQLSGSAGAAPPGVRSAAH